MINIVKDYLNDRVRLGILALSTFFIWLVTVSSPGLIIVLVQVMTLPVAVAAAIIVGASAYKEWHLYEGRIDIWRRELDVTVDEIMDRPSEPQRGTAEE